MEERFFRKLFSRRIRRFVMRNWKPIGLICLVLFGFLLLDGPVSEHIEDNHNAQSEILINTDAAGPAINIAPTNNSNFEIHYIDVGQGDASLIICDGKYMLIDAGENDYGDIVVNYLKNININNLDVVVGTHPDSDHIGGLDTVISSINCKDIYLSGKLSDSKSFKDVLDSINKTGNSYIVPNVGDQIILGSAKIDVLGPVKEYENNNNNSIVLMITYDGKKFLFTGDAEKESEADIISKNIDLKADVLKCGHHGSKTSSSKIFIDKVNPEYAIISCGKDNAYGHPHKETLTLLRMLDIKTFRTDTQGNIILKVVNGQIQFNVSSTTNWNDGNGNEAVVYDGEYVLNEKSKKFHLPTCEGVAKMSEKNKKITNQTRYELIDSGYEPCNACNP